MMTSLEKELDRPIALDEVKAALAEEAARLLGCGRCERVDPLPPAT